VRSKTQQGLTIDVKDAIVKKWLTLLVKKRRRQTDVRGQEHMPIEIRTGRGFFNL
jgi:hypothetical protein